MAKRDDLTFYKNLLIHCVAVEDEEVQKAYRLKDFCKAQEDYETKEFRVAFICYNFTKLG